MHNFDYERLRRLASEIGRQHSSVASADLDPIGLVLHDSPHRWDYFCTPLNSVTFGSTGGDGVHFGLLTIDGNEAMPVVMTVPMSDRHNIIVGASLFDFLRVGCVRGFFSLAELAYDWEDAIDLHSTPDEDAEPEELGILRLLRSEFMLVPHADLGEHLAQLQAGFAEHIQIPDFEEWSKSHGV